MRRRAKAVELEAYYRHIFKDYDELRRSQWWGYRIELTNAAERAASAGGTPPFEVMGMGAQGVVLCDRRYAYKVARRPEDAPGGWRGPQARLLADEAEWLSIASQIKKVRPHVAAFVDWNPKLGVLTRRCVRGTIGTWGRSSKVRAVFEAVEPYMLAAGWGMPELKDDSIVFTRGGKGKIVDAGFALRISNRFLTYVESLIEGKRRRDPSDYAHDLSTLAHEIRAELLHSGKGRPPMDQRRARNILDKLYELGARRD